MLTINNLDQLLKMFLQSIKNGGATFNYELSGPVKNGYMVSLYGYETKISNFNSRSLSEKISYFIDFIDKNHNKLKRNSGLFIGIWYEKKTDTLYLDLSVRYVGLDNALKFGKDQKQISIYDIVNDKVIYI
jgi:hypothetical protein